jgi:hypothetical protein
MEESRWLLATATVVILRARSANLTVEVVSSAHMTEGDTVATMVVRQLPPRDSCSRWVSFESRNGTWARSLIDSAPITVASVDRLWLMDVISPMRSRSSVICGMKADFWSVSSIYKPHVLTRTSLLWASAEVVRSG